MELVGIIKSAAGAGASW